MSILRERIMASLTPYEAGDCNAVGHILINQKIERKDVAVITTNPYLLLLIFVSLLRNYKVRVHILNPAEGVEELQRLLFFIQPDYVVFTDRHYAGLFKHCKKVVVNEETISEKGSDELLKPPYREEYTIKMYSPPPTKIISVESSMVETMVESITDEMYKLNLHGVDPLSLIPIASNNPDYLLYYIALKINSPTSTIDEKGNLMKLMKLRAIDRGKTSSTLFIPKKEFTKLWNEEINSMFEHRLIFKSYLKKQWFVNFLIRRRIKGLFRGFKGVVIIGLLNNNLMIDILRNIPNFKIHTIFPIDRALQYGPISNSLSSLIVPKGFFRQDMLCKAYGMEKKPLKGLSFSIPSKEDDLLIYRFVDPSSRFIEGSKIVKNGETKEQYFHLGNVENTFEHMGSLIFPETLEKVVNSYPFIRFCALLTFNNTLTLVIVPQLNILDANRINYKMFGEIIKKQISSFNKILPESHRIQHYLITPSLIEEDRNGNVIRTALTECYKQ